MDIHSELQALAETRDSAMTEPAVADEVEQRRQRGQFKNFVRAAARPVGERAENQNVIRVRQNGFHSGVGGDGELPVGADDDAGIVRAVAHGQTVAALQRAGEHIGIIFIRADALIFDGQRGRTARRLHDVAGHERCAQVRAVDGTGGDARVRSADGAGDLKCELQRAIQIGHGGTPGGGVVESESRRSADLEVGKQGDGR